MTRTALGQLEGGGGDLYKLHSYSAKESEFPTLVRVPCLAGTSEEALLAYRPAMRLILPFSVFTVRYATLRYVRRTKFNHNLQLHTETTALLRQDRQHTSVELLQNLLRFAFCFVFLFRRLEGAGF